MLFKGLNQLGPVFKSNKQVETKHRLVARPMMYIMTTITTLFLTPYSFKF
jgi:hypothetical protein